MFTDICLEACSFWRGGVELDVGRSQDTNTTATYQSLLYHEYFQVDVRFPARAILLELFRHITKVTQRSVQNSFFLSLEHLNLQ